MKMRVIPIIMGMLETIGKYKTEETKDKPETGPQVHLRLQVVLTYTIHQ